MIDAISDETLHVSENGGEAVGGFTWSLHFTWHQTFEREMERRRSLADYIRFVWLVPDLFSTITLYPTIYLVSFTDRHPLSLPLHNWIVYQP